jgi:RimJ/RimL family protein N-acetyltransferase
MIEVMKKANFAISPASTILYELCCIKMPILSGYYVENQKNIYNQLSKDNVIYKGGDLSKYSKLDFTVHIDKIIEDKHRINKLHQQKKLFDGKNKNRLLGLINSLNITFIKANKKHVKQVYNWSNDNLTRQNSYNSNKIEYNDHFHWFNKKIIDKKVLFLIILINHEPAGIVRFEIKNSETIIGILISKEYRGQGLSVEILKKAAFEYFAKFDYPIFASIKKENTASLKSFTKAGYSIYKEEIIHNVGSYIYKLEKDDI